VINITESRLVGAEAESPDMDARRGDLRVAAPGGIVPTTTPPAALKDQLGTGIVEGTPKAPSLEPTSRIRTVRAARPPIVKPA